MAHLILVRGIPGSGKSTLAHMLANSYETAHVLEADMYFMKDGVYQFDRDKLRQAHQWCQEMTKSHLQNDSVAIVSNTFTTSKELKPYFELAKRFDITPSVFLCQNDWGSIHNVPEETLAAMKARFQYDISHLFKDLND